MNSVNNLFYNSKLTHCVISKYFCTIWLILGTEIHLLINIYIKGINKRLKKKVKKQKMEYKLLALRITKTKFLWLSFIQFFYCSKLIYGKQTENYHEHIQIVKK